MSFSDRPYLPALLLSIAILAGLAIVGWGLSTRSQQAIISTTGSASQNATADQASWTIVLSSIVGDPDNTAFMSKDITAITNDLTSKKLAGMSVSTVPVSSSANYSYDKNGDATLTGYTVTASLTVTTTDVDTIDSLYHSNDFDTLVTDASVTPSAPQYFISTLPALRISLLGAAIKDAKARSEQIAKSGGSTLGPLASASSEAVQVLPPNSDDQQGGYGSYDTSTIQKVVTVTVGASFYVH